MTKDASASAPSEEEAERQSRSIAKLREDVRRKEGLLRAAQAQLEEVKGRAEAVLVALNGTAKSLPEAFKGELS